MGYGMAPIGVRFYLSTGIDVDRQSVKTSFVDIFGMSECAGKRRKWVREMCLWWMVVEKEWKNSTKYTTDMTLWLTCARGRWAWQCHTKRSESGEVLFRRKWRRRCPYGGWVYGLIGKSFWVVPLMAFLFISLKGKFISSWESNGLILREKEELRTKFTNTYYANKVEYSSIVACSFILPSLNIKFISYFMVSVQGVLNAPLTEYEYYYPSLIIMTALSGVLKSIY